ncbi:MAG: amidohydrolase family protein [Candidatus Heimdallarchaeota archaeon]|nr:amidohydrolase family protein [Candidatus Heimdallarchaeota archaeon]
MKFDLTDLLQGLESPEITIWDSHVHIWNAEAFIPLCKMGEVYGVTHFMGIAAPDVKETLESDGFGDKITFAYYLPIDAFAGHEPERIIKAIDEAHSKEYSMVKLWFGPRFLDFFNAEKPFAMNLSIFEPVFSLIEDYSIPMDIHVADPDFWYSTKYKDSKRYRTKEQALNEFRHILRRHPSLKTISVHFNSLPEDLIQLERDLEIFPNLYIDTASTKWIIRELGKNRIETKTFFEKYYKRLLFATDLSVGWENQGEEYLATRYWSQRLFWETDYSQVELPFPDNDNPDAPTYINGLNLPKKILEHFYWKNAETFFGESMK